VTIGKVHVLVLVLLTSNCSHIDQSYIICMYSALKNQKNKSIGVTFSYQGSKLGLLDWEGLAWKWRKGLSLLVA